MSFKKAIITMLAGFVLFASGMLFSYNVGHSRGLKVADLRRVEFDVWIASSIYEMLDVISEHSADSYPGLSRAHRNVRTMLLGNVDMVESNAEYFSNPSNKTRQFDVNFVKAKEILRKYEKELQADLVTPRSGH